MVAGSTASRKRSKNKKPVKGAAANFITRNRAIKKLQVTLADFRRLCILKGIYPREPRNKKKANRGSTAPVTFYYTKDIQFLLHEPLLQKFREYKIFSRKLASILGRGLRKEAKKFEEEHKPVYDLSHLIKERYPSFADALRDLDDALCMLFLFSTLPATTKVKVDVAGRCKQLCSEFEHYVIRTGALRKAFLSIKGIYYQAEVKGQSIFWIVPYQFSQHVPNDVDLRVMHTFLEFYETLVGFVNYRLFADLNLVYPPRIDMEKLNGSAGLDALILETVEEVNRKNLSPEETEPNDAQKSQKVASEQRLESLESKLKTLETAVSEQDAKDEDAITVGQQPNKEAEHVDTDASEAFGDLPTIHDRSTQRLFSNCVFFLSREVPRHSLELVIRSFGGLVCWDPASGVSSPFNEDHKAITHHICDRPRINSLYLGRTYLQPQWVYDSANAGKLLAPEKYAPGARLPPHLSPFVEAKEGDYIPPEARGEETAKGVDAEGEDMEEEKEEEEVRVAAGKNRRREQKEENERREQKEENERRELAMGMMSKKDKRLYGQIQYGKRKAVAKAETLKRKRLNADRVAKV